MKSIIKRIGTGRDRYYMGYDPAYESDKAAWCICRVDTKTGVTTVLESGIGEPPANDQAQRPPGQATPSGKECNE